MKNLDLFSEYQRSPEWRALSSESQRSYTRSINHLPNMEIQRINQKVIGTAHAALRPGAGNSFRAAMVGYWRWANRMGYARVPITLPRARTKEIPAWKREALEPYLESANASPIALAMALAFYTAQRLSDILAIRWTDISEEGLSIRQQKTKEELLIPIHPKLQGILDGLVRCGPYIVQHSGKRYAIGSFRVLYRKAVPKSLPPFHGIRKASCIAMAEGGATTHQIMSVSGHKTLQMVSLYTKGVNKHALAKEAIRSFGRKT